MRLAQKLPRPSALRRFTVASACALLGAGLCATTLALSVHVDALAANDDQASPKSTGPVPISAGVMQGLVLHKVQPVYPVDAKKAGVQGRVELEAVISKEGEIEHSTSSPDPVSCSQASLDAVRQWTYKPYILKGEPVDVQTTINVIYTLAKAKN